MKFISMVSKLLKILGFMSGLFVLSNCASAPVISLPNEKSFQEEPKERSFQDEYGERLFLDFSNKQTYVGFDRDNDDFEDFKVIYKIIDKERMMSLEKIWDDKNRDKKVTDDEIYIISLENPHSFVEKYGQSLFLKFDEEHVIFCYDRDEDGIEDFRLVYEALYTNKSGCFLLELREIWDSKDNDPSFGKDEKTIIQPKSIEYIL